MPRALVVNAGYYTAAGAGNAAATPMAGDTFVVPNFTSGGAYLEQVWASGTATDWISVKSARMHDANQGIRVDVPGPTINHLLPFGVDQPLYSGDAPVVTIDQTAANTGAVALMYSFDDLPGANPRLGSWADVQPRIMNISGVEVDLPAVPAIGQYSAGVAINSTFDNFKADTDYALLGYLVPTSVLLLAIAGQDTGNLKVGGPGVSDSKETANWFVRLSNDTGRPCIPIIAANNKGGTLVSQTSNSAAAAQHVSLIFAELR